MDWRSGRGWRRCDRSGRRGSGRGRDDLGGRLGGLGRRLGWLGRGRVAGYVDLYGGHVGLRRRVGLDFGGFGDYVAFVDPDFDADAAEFGGSLGDVVVYVGTEGVQGDSALHGFFLAGDVGAA